MTNFIIFGAGALGSRIAFDLAFPDNTFTLIDDDTVSTNNVNTRTAVYSNYHIGARKVIVLSEILWHKSRSICAPVQVTVTENNIMKLTSYSASIAIDTFDNMESRAIISNNLHGVLPVLHIGVSLQRTGAIMWNDSFIIPSEVTPRGENRICTNALGASILRMTASTAVSVIEKYLETGVQENYWITPLQIHKL